METLELEMVKTEKELPEGWEWKKLGEVYKTTSGGTPNRKEPRYYNGNIPWVKSGELNSNTILDTEEKITEEAIKNSSAKVFPAGTLLIALYGATIGKLARLGIDAATNQAVCGIFKNEKQNLNYLYWYLMFKRPELVDSGTGGAQPNISQAILKNLTVPVPPLEEQHAIVEKIEALFSELDHAIAQLQIAKQQLHTYRQSVLKHAFEGYYTGGMEGWMEGCIKDISIKVQIGPFGSQLHKEDYITNGIPLINPMHIKKGVIEADCEYSITVDKRDSLPNYILEEGDIIMGRRGEMGRCALVTKKEANWFCGTGSLYVRPNKVKVDSKFLLMYLVGKGVKEYLENAAAGTTMANLNLKIVNSIPFIYPELKVQQQIVSEIETRLSESDHLLTTINNQLTQSEALRQSILQRAFEGRL